MQWSSHHLGTRFPACRTFFRFLCSLLGTSHPQDRTSSYPKSRNPPGPHKQLDRWLKYMITPCLAKPPGRTPSGLLESSCTFGDQLRPRWSGQTGGSAALQLECAKLARSRRRPGCLI
ncbi:hypothetical protein BO94DRAFT_260387 [Aspergillus sclerotioniger CBS 115572]|uniref:Uncharacterized protein n=1 Tax=Aspergillus sclerotioniger CBS 115572 TaxID=1450535 RepID=A0A317VB43_9EURO|nr:hypothetical protein BO94DRAFT_260387 [Aspergillus sclerotioniger CBS 115572]PWY71573.1 hypothetical protein BO94DRAFT_260387 [Aspergillus sclerotioniger CBS 115572]